MQNCEIILKDCLANFNKLLNKNESERYSNLMIQMDFSNDYRLEPYLLQGGYHCDIQKYYIVEHPQDAHFTKEEIHITTLQEFEEKFIQMANSINLSFGYPQLIEVIVKDNCLKLWENKTTLIKDIITKLETYNITDDIRNTFNKYHSGFGDAILRLCQTYNHQMQLVSQPISQPVSQTNEQKYESLLREFINSFKQLPYEYDDEDEPSSVSVNFSEDKCNEPYLLTGGCTKGKYWIEECPEYAHHNRKISYTSELSEFEEILVRKMHEITKSFAYPKEMRIIFKTCFIKLWKNDYKPSIIE